MVQRLPLPAATAWIHSVRKPVLMKTDRAQKLLKWKPKHTAKATLNEMVEAHRATPHAGAVAAVPDLAVDATAEVVQRLPLPAATAWIHSVRKPVLMKTDRAQKLLKWKPEHTAKATLKQMIEAHYSDRSTPNILR